jgi:hypothetical protein
MARLTDVNRDFLKKPRPTIQVTAVMAEQLCQRLP